MDYPQPGEVLMGTYRLERIIGEGGSSRVYQAVQVSMQRPVALKLLSPVFSRDKLLPKRFAQEARILVKLHHPNLVELYDLGTTEGGLPFIVMEMLTGQTVASYIDTEGSMEVERAGLIARQILTGLSEVHEAGIIHRDLKPSNLFLCDYTGKDDLAKILDFGIAKVMTPDEDSGLPGIETQRLGGGIVGSPRYMAPELFKREPLTRAADIFSFGLLMAELLSGEPVIKARTDAEIVKALMGKEPLAMPPKAFMTPFGPMLSRCLARSPADRYQTCDEAMCDLVAAGMGGEETVQFSTTEALERYERERVDFEQATTQAIGAEEAERRLAESERGDAAGRASPSGPGFSGLHMKTSLPGFTQGMDMEEASQEAIEAAGLTRRPTNHDEPTEAKTGEGSRARIYYAVAIAAVLIALAILASGLLLLHFFKGSPGDDKGGAIEPPSVVCGVFETSGDT